jgi:hypothetical protein
MGIWIDLAEIMKRLEKTEGESTPTALTGGVRES